MYIELNLARVKIVPDWSDFLSSPVDPQEQELLRCHECTGRPLGSKRLIRKLKRLLDRPLHPRNVDRPAKQRN